MILGIGSDLIDIRRIEKSLERYGERFIQRFFTEIEQAQVRPPRRSAPPPMPSASPPRRPAPRRSAPASREGVFWRDMGVVNLPGGKPTMQLTGGAAARLARLLPPGHAPSST